MAKVSLDELLPGAILTRDVTDPRGSLIVSAGKPVTDKLVAAFRTRGITHVDVRGVETPMPPVAFQGVNIVDAPPLEGATQTPRASMGATSFLKHWFRHADLDNPCVGELYRLCGRYGTRSTMQQPFTVGQGESLEVIEAEALAANRSRTGTAADWLRGLGKLPTLPDVYVRLTELIEHPRSSAKDIAKVVEEDAVLTGKLLQLVNSAFYGLSRHIDEVSRALALLGTEQVRQLALAIAVSTVFRNVPSEYISMRSFWMHSLATGMAARQIARLRGEKSLESIFVSGLLHDLGRLVLCVHRPKFLMRAATLGTLRDMPLAEAERVIMGYDHAAIAGALLDSWNIPVRQRQIVACHHEYTLAGSYAVDAATIQVANNIVVAMEFGSSGELGVPPVPAAAWEVAGVSPANIVEIVELLKAQLNDVLRLFMPEKL